MGDGTSEGKLYPTPVAGGLTFAQISAGFYHTCGVTTAGGPYCGGWNIDGQLGDGTTAAHFTPNATIAWLVFRS